MESSGKRAETSMKTEGSHIKVSFHHYATIIKVKSLTFSNQKVSVSPGNEYNVEGLQESGLGRLTRGSTLYSSSGSDNSALLSILSPFVHL